AAVARPGLPRLTAAEIKELEDRTAHLNQQLGTLAEFILPGGCPAGAALHLARSICRRAERQCVRLGRDESLGQYVIPYLNRLGDALFVLARGVNRQGNRPETLWRK
ncbi:ATP:cob(I)alamin adenosyltransferase, partial [bacterium]|nr:ATP:cob(I)alamin adenosyltransferase [bacterium]